MSINTEINLLKMRRTKILATLGPASCEKETIRQLIVAGVNVFRLNMSHGDHEFHHQTYHDVRSLAEELGRPIGILADLCGPKIRTGRFRDDHIELRTDQEVIVTTRDVIGEPGLIPSQYRALADDVEPDDHILLADGTLELVVKKVEGTEITCTVLFGGKLGNNKGINLPGVNVSAPSLTEKDREDAEFAMDLGVDFFALSFVRRAEDINDLRKIIKTAGKDINIIAKVEKPEALDEARAVIDAADGIMVARGDLGVELKPELVPVAQHQLIDMARKKFKPVIVATQM
ncbi:MAG: pyruvate kinase, partial [Gammaproteobacteria bacterium]|nr:pyruvate kinase [Gammaproteobacteria bacterium]